MDENRNQNQIIRKDARSCFVESLSDAFEIGKVHLAFATYDLTRPAGSAGRPTTFISILLWMSFWIYAVRLNAVNLGICCKTKNKTRI